MSNNFAALGFGVRIKSVSPAALEKKCERVQLVYIKLMLRQEFENKVKARWVRNWKGRFYLVPVSQSERSTSSSRNQGT